jgi:hypothetical protein
MLIGLAGRFSLRRSPMPPADHVKVSGQSLLAPLVQRRVPIRVLFGEQDQTYLDQLKLGRLPSLEAASEIIDTVITPVTVHRMPTVRSQETVLQFVRDCLAQDAAAPSPTSRRRGAALLVND